MSTHKAALRGEETMSDEDNKSVSNVTVTRQPLSLSMCPLNKEQDQTASDSHYRDTAQTCANEEEEE